ncbi:conserved hypothetical protein [Ricinus communis]|uniref:Uncharacterized protein n=2 Tax=Ricinus communis TaxID=3988 RepID=B9SGQ0_RICCO|nr:conserved hypothetical protein [Ricinus communis]
MGLKSSFTSFFLLYLLLALPCISRGTEGSQVADSDIYEIDYRGPETHSSAMPPPGRSHGRPFINRQNAMSSQKSKPSSRGDGENDKKIHG